MANADHLILAIGVGAILIGITVGAILYQPPPPPLRADIRIETTQESYRMGEEVVARLENLGPLSLCTTGQWPWNVHLQVAEEWLAVKTVTVAHVLGQVRPGDSLGFRWIAESDPYWEDYALSGFSFAEVIPGEYRVGFGGWECDENWETVGEPVGFYAYFELVA